VYVQNEQMTLFEQICYDNMLQKWGKSGFYNFARSAVDRSRARTAIWNGDSHSNWTGLQYSISSGIRAGLIGFSQWGSDTGGYIRSAAPIADQPSEELWARWMQFSAFSPVYELMLGTNHTVSLFHRVERYRNCTDTQIALLSTVHITPRRHPKDDRQPTRQPPALHKILHLRRNPNRNPGAPRPLPRRAQ
jgi:Glycosyl hydrolases family 31